MTVTAETDFDRDVAAIARIDAVPTILDVVCRTTGMGFAAVVRVTGDRWIACAVRDEIQFGLEPGRELKVETTICSEVRDRGDAVIIDNVAADATFRSHPTPAMYGFQSYISFPIRRRNGEFFGTLCAVDPRPMQLSAPERVGMFKLFADLIGFHLDAQDRLDISEAALLDERRVAELRDQFIAVLGHDLRNPLASIDAGVRMPKKQQLDANAMQVVALIQNTVKRMSGLIENVLDFARVRLGGGLMLDRNPSELLAAVLEQVVAETRASWPDRELDVEIASDAVVNCDRARIAQLFSNLLSNAFAHGDADKPVSVRAFVQGGVFELSVSNAGDPIPPVVREKLFQPFFRASAKKNHKGLGLGLHIASEIAREHGGSLDVISNTDETRFTFKLPTA